VKDLLPGLRLAAALGTVVGLAGCGSSPSPGPVQPPPPQPLPNQLPIVRSVELEQRRVEVGASVIVRAVVEDAETPLDQLRYEWTATVGTFSGEGREVTWQAPAEISEPLNVTLKLTVVETLGGAASGQTQRTVFDVPEQVRLHDSLRELTALVRTFLDDFIDNSVSPSECVRNFSDGCPGKQAELRDLQRVRSDFTMLGASSYSIRSVNITEPWGRAQMEARCEFVSREKASGTVGVARGTCSLTGVYENDRWWLCDSHFSGTTTNTAFIIG
jgi:hypothetical protein